MPRSLWLVPALALSVTPLVAQALEAACEPYLAAVEKSAAQPSRHAISEMQGARAEGIATGGKFYSNVGGKWREMKIDLFAVERKLAGQVRSGEVKITNCKNAGQQTFDGAKALAIDYVIEMGGIPPIASRAYISADGLLIGQTSKDVKATFRYSNVKAPL